MGADYLQWLAIAEGRLVEVYLGEARREIDA